MMYSSHEIIYDTSRLPGFAREEGREGGREGARGGREREGMVGGEGGEGGSEGALLYFLKLYNVFNDNVQSIR